ncbi:MAG: acyl--CoA ligase [Deltaproteobacteria bacterium]|jgi:carnitine-CoA ligase|nr:acyl--CoA ligase [Deltaproteobacteria bacterium]MBT4641330.1 acyl--CoA ligase [Deltaproteobacteria bacterium]MBT6504533.1 acyl--CoA ligase [Deltaproteobacteria bacterium]MBT7155587.1 acyl--CoA ligase [Deltaproteobacteria bacterium]MBT7712058.1 acyl--CoA ligase [Deltaproteobacteria bacterium]
MEPKFSNVSTEIGRQNSLRQLLEYQIQRYGDKPFIIFVDKDNNEEILTYRQFGQQVNRLANWFLSIGITKGDFILCHLPNSIGFVTAIHAATHIGAVLVPSIIFDVADDLKYKLNFSKAKMVITDGEYYPEFNKILEQCPSVKDVVIYRSDDRIPGTHVWEDALAGSSQEAPPPVQIDPLQDAAQMLFTSGTTARPKGVILTHGNFLYMGNGIVNNTALRPDDRIMVVLPLFHVNAMCCSWFSTLTAGASIVICEIFNPAQFVPLAHRYNVTFSAQVGAVLKALLAQPEHPLERELKMWRTFYAIKISDADWDEFERRFNTTILDGYGLTETMAPCTMFRIWGENRQASVGLPFPGMEVVIVDDNRLEVPSGELGEIVVKGQPGLSLFKEYYMNPQATAEALVNNWFFTGDSGKMDAEGYIYFVDRKKDVIKRKGENVSPAEVDRVLIEHPAVEEVAVIGMPDPRRDEATMAVLKLNQGFSVTEEEIREYCLGKMAKFKIPDHVRIWTKEFSKTSIGKIKKNLLKEELLKDWPQN